MFKKSLLLMLLMAFMAPWAANAQETLTVCDGTTTNSYIPFYGSYVDTQGCTCEFIIPAETEGMSDMEGGAISKLTFYISNTPQTWGSPTIQVYMGEVDGTTLSSISGPTNFTTVYTGIVSNQTNPLEIELTDAYTYEGGNLFIGTYVQTASSTFESTSFYGVSAPSGSSIYFSGSSYGSATVQSFLPKTTFTYETASTGCDKPATLTASQIQPNSAMLNWEGGSTPGHGYNVEIKGGQYTDWTRYASNVSQGCLFAHLIENTAYQARVQVVCSEDGEEPVLASGWTSTSFNTPAYFSNFAVAIVPGEGNKAIFSWTENGFTPTEWQLCINGDENNLISMTNNPFTYNGLTPDVSTTAKMRAFVGDDTGEWSNTVTFTPTDSYSITLNDGTNTNDYVPFYGYYCDMGAHSQFIIPATDLDGLQWASFDKLTFFSSKSSATWDNARFDIYMMETTNTVFDNTTLLDWTTMTKVGSNVSVSISDNKMEITLTSPFTYQGGNLLIGFNEITNGSDTKATWYGKTGTTNTGIYNYSSYKGFVQFLPKMTIEYTPGEEPDCLPVSGLSFANVDHESAKLSWTASESDETAWKLQYRIDGATGWTTVSVLAENLVNGAYPLTNLQSNTTYNWQVAAWCDTNNDEAISTYTAGSNFTTECEAISDLPLVTFDDYTGTSTSSPTNNLPDCWNYLNTNTSSYYNGYPVIYNNESSSYSGSNHLRFYTYYAADEYAILPKMESLEGMRITFYARYYSSMTNLIVGVMSNPNDASTFVPKETITDLTTTYKQYKVDFSGLETNQKYIALKMSTSYSNSYYIYVDDITVAETPACEAPESVTVSATTAHGFTATLTPGTATQNQWCYYWSTENVAPGNVAMGTTQTATFTVDYNNNLLANTDYYLWVGVYCEVDQNYYWCAQPATFKTKADCFDMEVTTITFADITFNSATINWTPVGDATQWRVEYSTSPDFSTTTGYNTEANSWAVEGTLEPEQTYYVRVAPYCELVEQYTPWSTGTFSFTTEVACPAPVLNNPTDITAHGATFSWTGSYDSYNVKYRIPAYTEATFEEGFESTDFPPQGWSVINAYGYTEWEASTYYYHKGNKSAFISYNSDGHENYLITSSMTPAEGEFLEFYVSAENYASTTLTIEISTTTAAADAFTETLATYTTGSNGTIGTTSLSTFVRKELMLTDYVGQEIYIAFHVVDNNGASLCLDDVTIGHAVPATQWVAAAENITANTITIDDATIFAGNTPYEVEVVAICNNVNPAVEVESNVKTFTTDIACPAPTALNHANVKSTQADLSWTNGGAENWVLAYKKTADENFTEVNLGTDDVTIEGTTVTYTLTGLDVETAYTVKVRDNCEASIEGDGYSEWTSEVVFTTLSNCAAPYQLTEANLTASTADLKWEGEQEQYNVRYRMAATINQLFFEGFEDEDEFADWQAYGVESTNYEGSSRFGRITSAKKTDNYGFSFNSWSTSTDYNQYLISPELSVNGQLSFYYRSSSTSSTGEMFRVGYSSDGTNVDDFTWGEIKSTKSTNWSEFKETIPAGTKHFAINYCVTSSQYCLYIDDIAINEVNTYAWDETNTNVTSPLTIDNLEVYTEYEWQVQGINASCENGVTEWSGISSFTTYATFTKEINAYNETNKQGWYLIASPLAGETNPTAVTNLIDETPANYALFGFDQSKEDEWRNYKAHSTDFKLEPGKGYLYANTTGNNLTFTGVPYSGTGEVSLTYTDDAEFAGWNLIGNPFATAATLNKPFYKMNDDGDGFTAQIEDLTTTIAAMEGVFVQVTEAGTATFTPQTSKGGQQVIAKTNIVLSGNKGKVLDNAIIRFDNGETLGKFQLNENSSKIYMPVEGKDYAIVNAENQGEMPVNFKAEENGTYSLSFNAEEVSFSYLHLIDNMTGNDIDLLQTPSYTFNATTTDYESRFKLVFCTGVNDNSDSFAFCSNGNWIISNEGEATLQVIDVTGRILSSETVNGSVSKSINAAPGVYMIRLINGENVKVQKVVIE